MYCIFCNNDLDNSDEHILPESINGKLHSKNIICSYCNIKVFGEKIDPILSEIFRPIIHSIGLKNAKIIQAEDDFGNKYLINKNGEVKQLKTELKIEKKEDGFHISIQGDENEIIKYLEKKSDRLKKYKQPNQIINLESYNFKKSKVKTSKLMYQYVIEVSPQIILEIYKIALEFYSYNNLDIKLIKHTLLRVKDLDESIDEIIFCNFDCQIRMFKKNEISHLIIIKSDEKEHIIYCYIELFNILCAFVPLVYNYYGSKIEYIYHQDAITGRLINENIVLTKSPSEIISSKMKYTAKEFGLLISHFFARYNYRNLEATYDRYLDEILQGVKSDITNGHVDNNDYEIEYIKRATKFVVEKSIIIPYFIEDLEEEQINQLNFIHSNIFEKDYEFFRKSYSQLIGISIQLDGKDIYTLCGFKKYRLIELNNSIIIKVFCVLINKNDQSRQYIPYRPLITSIYKQLSN